ncbi:hypothetical protein NADFUDRAFT_48500 [Nadsonia fulvescens var. elongata DSM 6958]|uniref:COX assembly mitochondrial protein n=1 Tax=Nadsonia fulvescens var. elongata DSM 6958 TaxID=857566 RepID=A0A1E3PQX0_9ASCO|nr:hypothetical protein NADFUDRAFT_48500 [Nadsonia fulvescens var. elongata DSM 6958]
MSEQTSSSSSAPTNIAETATYSGNIGVAVPGWILSPAEEGIIRDKYQTNGRVFCRDILDAFAACSHHRPVSFVWKCRTEKKELLECMRQYNTTENYDLVKDEFLKEKFEKMNAAAQEQKK